MNSSMMFHVFDTVGTAAVVIWMGLHMLSWMVVESLRLWRSTMLKIRRVWRQTEVEE